MTDEIEPSFKDMVLRPKVTDEQLKDALNYVALARLALTNIYPHMEEFDDTFRAPGGSKDILDEYYRRLMANPNISPQALREGMHVTISGKHPKIESREKKGLLSWRKSTRLLPSDETAAIEAEPVRFIPAEQVQANVKEAAESGAILSDALITKILDDYGSHLARWRTKPGRRDDNHPAKLIERLLVIQIELSGTPKDGLIESIAETTKTDIEKWRQLVRHCEEDNKLRLDSGSLFDFLDFLEPGMNKGGPGKR